MTFKTQNLEAIAMNVRVARARSGITAIELSAKSGVCVATISFIENAKKEVRVSTLQRLAEALGVPLEELLKGE